MHVSRMEKLYWKTKASLSTENLRDEGLKKDHLIPRPWLYLCCGELKLVIQGSFSSSLKDSDLAYFPLQNRVFILAHSKSILVWIWRVPLETDFMRQLCCVLKPKTVWAGISVQGISEYSKKGSICSSFVAKIPTYSLWFSNFNTCTWPKITFLL